MPSYLRWGCSSSGRALDWQSRGKGVKYPQLHHSSLIAAQRPGVMASLRLRSRVSRSQRRPAAALPVVGAVALLLATALVVARGSRAGALGVTDENQNFLTGVNA